MSPKKLRSLHRQVGLWASIWFVLAAVTTLIINHREQLFQAAPAAQGPYGQYLLSHAICASEPDLVLVGTASGLFLSENSGKSFRPITLPVPAEQVVGVAFHPNEPSHYYAVLRKEGIFSSLDSGKLWTRIAFPAQAPIQSFQVGFDGSLSVLSSEGLHRRIHDDWTLVPNQPTTSDQATEEGRRWMRMAYDLHDGRMWGQMGVLITDLVALSLLLLVITGWIISRQTPRDKDSPTGAGLPAR